MSGLHPGPAPESKEAGMNQNEKAEVERLREALQRVLRFEASYGENDIPDEDREFARAALRGGGK